MRHAGSISHPRRIVGRLTWVAACALLALGCSESGFGSGPEEDSVLDGMLDGLTGAEAVEHAAGDDEFSRIFTPATGLGPAFVAASCESCHVGDGKGHPAFNLTRFGRMTGGVFDPMVSEGGPQLQSRAIAQYVAERIPAAATGMSVFTAPAVAGLGFLDAVEDATLLALADEHDTDGDGISGRVQLIDTNEFVNASIAQAKQSRTMVNGAYIGRFGKKAGTVNLLHQIASAYIEDMGVTSDLHPTELHHPGGLLDAADRVVDPEVSQSTVRSVLFYLRTLRAPPRRSADHPDVVAGGELFVQSKCSSCHVPTLRTGPSHIPALNNVEFHPFTDMLLHDMGSELDDGYTEGRAKTSEWRTAPLWGAGLAHRSQGGRSFYLHDGRARTIRDAIGYHGGEAAGSRSAFNALTPKQQALLIKYIESL